MTRDRYTIGIDIGTYEAKGVLATRDGSIAAFASRPVQLRVPRPGWAEHDPETDWWANTCALTNDLIDRGGIAPDQVDAVALSAIGPCVVPVDVDGRSLRPAILYGIDTRATHEIAELTDRLGEARTIERCGNALTTQSVGPKILWLRRHEPEAYAAAHRFFTSTSYLVYRLTGRSVVDHYSAACFTPLYDVQRRGWAPDLGAGIVDPARLGDVAWTTEIAGTLTRHAAEASGLRAGTPVLVGTIDAAAEAVSAGVVRPGDMMLMYGTTLFMIEVVARPIRDARLWSAPFLFPDTHALMAGMATTGALTRWLRDQFARELVEREGQGGENAYAVLAAEAAAAPVASDGLVVLPYFSGERTPIQDPHAKGVVFGLTLAHTRAHVYRAALESVGLGIRHHLDVLAQIGATPRRLVAVGGGTKNPLWLQATSDIVGLPQELPSVTVGAAFGDAWLARVACDGRTADWATSSWSRIERTVDPRPEHRGAYDAAYATYRALYERTRTLMHASDGDGDGPVPPARPR